ncbi:hypothetical protein [Angustibacter aerolatus]
MRRALPVLVATLAMVVAVPSGAALAHDGEDHAVVVDGSTGLPIRTTSVPSEDGSPSHVDPAPAGVRIGAATPAAVVRAAGLTTHPAQYGTPRLAASGDVAHGYAAASTAEATAVRVPAGVAGNSSLGQHVSPSCSGTGTDGKRVQVLYAYESGQPNNFSFYEQALQSYVADVDDTFALSAKVGNTTDLSRRVRWVHDAACVPVIRALRLPAGTLTGQLEDAGLDAIIDAAKAAGIETTDRKLLTFADADELCGIGQVYPDDHADQGNANNVAPTMSTRIDLSCWSMPRAADGSTVGPSTPAHELMHNLGAVQLSAPHSTTEGHCTDEYDVMCYVDGGLNPRTGNTATTTTVCKGTAANPRADDALFDCRHDDYFNLFPGSNSYLARYWNTADSGYLDVVQGGVVLTRPSGSISGTRSVRGGRAVTLQVHPTEGSAVRWTAAASSCLPSGRTSTSVTVMCPANTYGTLSVTATLTSRASGVKGSVTTSVRVGATTTARADVSVRTAGRVRVGTAQPVTVRVLQGTAPVRAPVRLQTRTSSSQAWRTIRSGTTSTSGTATFEVTSPAAARRQYRAVADLAAANGWTTTAPAVRVVTVVRRSSKLTIARSGSRLSARLTREGRPLAAKNVTLQRRSGGRWVSVTTKRTPASGRVSTRQHPHRTTTYRWTYRGNTTTAPSSSRSTKISR